MQLDEQLFQIKGKKKIIAHVYNTSSGIKFYPATHCVQQTALYRPQTEKLNVI